MRGFQRAILRVFGASVTPSAKADGRALGLALAWGVHAVHTRDVSSFEEMVEKGKRMALRHQIAKGGDRIVLMAGIPFGTAGSTNVLHVARLIGDELERYNADKSSRDSRT